MAPLPPSNTPRLFYDYLQGTTTHTMMVRHDVGSTVSNVDLQVDEFLNAISALLVTTTISAVRAAAAGSDITLPVVSALVGTVYGTGTASPITDARQFSFTGRSTAGRRARVEVFGANAAPVDYRVTPTELPAIQTALDALANDPDVFEAIDGLSGVVWNQYMNFGLHDHYVKKAR